MKYRLLIVTALVGLLTAGLSACGTTPEAPVGHAAQTTPTPQPMTLPTPVPTVELTLGVSGIGEVKATQDADMVFMVTGTVSEVLVKEGDTVTKGQLLARLDTRIFDQQLHQAEAALANARAQEASLTAPPRAADAAAARAQTAAAQAALEQLRAGAKVQDLQSAEAALTTAQANLQSTRDRLSMAKTQAESQLDQAAQALTQAQARYAQTKLNWQYVQDTGNDPIVPKSTDPKTGKAKPNKLNDAQRESYYSQFVQAEAAMHQAEESVQLATAAAENARQNEISGIQIAEQQVVQAQAIVDKMRLPPDKDRLTAAQAAVVQSQAAQSRLTAAPRDWQTAQAQAGVAQAEAALELAKINREHAELRAPFDGVVAAINVDPGDPSTTGTQPAIKVVDVKKLRVDVQISDVDIARVTMGQQATISVDALPNTTFPGKISFIAPAATVVGNFRTYLVRIALDNQQGLRPGMSVRVDLATK